MQFKTLKEARAAGYRDLRRIEYGGEQIALKGHVLVREPKSATSRADWWRRGFEVPDDTPPHAHATARIRGATITWDVFRDDQVRPRSAVSKRRSAAAKQGAVGQGTIRQVCAAGQLDTDGLVALALRALHALNRRAKKYRDVLREGRAGSSDSADDLHRDLGRIYVIKTTFLDAMVRAGRAQVETFIHEREGAKCWHCADCDRDWGGEDDTCNGCDGSGELYEDEGSVETWAIVHVGSYRWHQPPREVTPAMLAVARPGVEHDPAQPAREIPSIKLTIEAQHRVVELAIERLRQVVTMTGETPSPTAGGPVAGGPVAGDQSESADAGA